jgi:hypothetical protein
MIRVKREAIDHYVTMLGFAMSQMSTAAQDEVIEELRACARARDPVEVAAPAEPLSPHDDLPSPADHQQ